MEDKTKMIIQTELTINSATDIYKMLAKELRSKKESKIKIPTSTPVDVTFVQILHAFLAKCKSLNKKVSFEIAEQNEFIRTLKQIGYYNITEVLQLETKGEKGENNV